MAACPKFTWPLKKYAKFLKNDEMKNFQDQDEETETMAVACNGGWKLYSGEKGDLFLSYLASDHLILTKQDVIMESFSLPCCKACLKGAARSDSILMLCKLQDGTVRRFRIQFDDHDNKKGSENRKQCTTLMKKFIRIDDYDDDDDSERQETVEINYALFDKMILRKSYAIDVPRENMQEILTLCMTDITFPSYVAEISKMLDSNN
uniref:Meiotic recombination protein REC114-like protein n=1 Tax=Parasteatoda tepidariorum TaxID=114398 RepID=A0A2L2YWD8_PARTP